MRCFLQKIMCHVSKKNIFILCTPLCLLLLIATLMTSPTNAKFTSTVIIEEQWSIKEFQQSENSSTDERNEDEYVPSDEERNAENDLNKKEKMQSEYEGEMDRKEIKLEDREQHQNSDDNHVTEGNPEEATDSKSELEEEKNVKDNQEDEYIPEESEKEQKEK